MVTQGNVESLFGIHSRCFIGHVLLYKAQPLMGHIHIAPQKVTRWVVVPLLVAVCSIYGKQSGCGVGCVTCWCFWCWCWWRWCWCLWCWFSGGCLVVERQCEIANVVAVRALSVVVADQQRGGWSGPRVLDDNALTRHFGCVRECLSEG